ncbi:phage tail tape measure protein [Clostridiales Family XIII bacterium ASD5510]|uniref:Phage tail tape measure protein n=2 Tax=Bacteria TaxID=2 RepID=A0A9J6QRS3_9FIRM|nr:phage tail tape measure protein [Hominibacterium faecale]MCU7378124.1 phage tail tape measure protein [Hominibacterium faecale]
MSKGKIMTTVVNIAGNIDPSLSKAVDGAVSSFGKIDKKSAITKAAIAGIAAGMGKAVKESFTYLKELGETFDDASDSIRIGTGATGEALQALNNDFNEVYKSVPTSTDAAAQAIADYNTKIGLTGPALQNISKQAIQVSDILNEDLGTVIDSSSKAFQQWKIDEENMSGAMDHVFKVSQSTGAGFSDLFGKVQKFGPQLQEMGYSFNTATSMIGQMEKAGVNVDEVMGAMKKSVSAMAKEGLSASEGLQIYYDKIKNAGSATEATTIASEIFGTRAGSTVATAIRDGTLAIDDFNASIEANGETISGAAGDTYDYAEKLQIMKQKAEVYLRPLAETVFDGINTALDWTLSHTTEIKAALKAIAVGLSGFAVAAIVTKLTSSLKEYGGVMKAVKSGQTALNTAMKANPAGLIILGITALVSAFVYFWNTSKSFRNFWIGLWNSIKSKVIEGYQAVKPILDMLGGVLKGVLGVAISYIMTQLSNLKLIFSGLISFISGVFTGNWRKAWEGVKSIFAGIFGGLSEVVKRPFNAVISLINKAISGINEISLDIPDFLGGGTLGFNIPKIPMLAAGGFTTGTSIAGEAGTEAVISFDRRYRSENLAYWTKAGMMLGAMPENEYIISGSGSSTINLEGLEFSPVINIQGDAKKQDIIEALRDVFPEFFDLLDEWFVGRDDFAYV